MIYLTHTQQTKNINLIFVSFKMGGYVNNLTWNYTKTVTQIKTFTIDQILVLFYNISLNTHSFYFTMIKQRLVVYILIFLNGSINFISLILYVTESRIKIRNHNSCNICFAYQTVK